MQRTVATVGGETITVQDLKKEFDGALIGLRRSFGSGLTEQQAKQLGLMDKALQQLVTQKQIDLEAKRLGIDVTEKATLEWIASLPEFRNKDGSFNKDLFRSAAQKEQLSEEGFITKSEGMIMRRELYFPFANSSKIPDAILEAVALARGQKRIFDVVTLADSSMHDIPAPDEKTLHDFYQKNLQSFTAPEYRAVTIARLSVADVAKTIDISDDQLKKEYETNLAQYTRPERRDILQAVVQDEAKAKQMATAARAGGNLTSAASDMGIKTVPINQTEEKTLLPELAKPVFALKQGQISDPVKSSLGWHVVQLKKITPAGTASFDEIKDELREATRKDQAADAAARMTNQLDDELAAGRALEDIADALKMRLVKIAAFDANGKMPDGKDPSELPNKDEVLKAAFGQNAGETSPIIDDRNGNYVVVRTDQVTPSAARPFDKAKDQVVAAWRTQQQGVRAAAEAETIAKGLREGKAPSSFAAQDGVEVRVSKPVSLLGDSDPSLPPESMSQIVKMKKGEVIVSSLPGKQIILRLAELVNPDAAADKADKVKVNTELNSRMTSELIEEYSRYLHDVFPAEVNQDVLDAMRQQGS
jgi:peptidyl-prolyl cis-trans isomerase D